jgi:hypothetical protein
MKVGVTQVQSLNVKRPMTGKYPCLCGLQNTRRFLLKNDDGNSPPETAFYNLILTFLLP